MTAREAAASMEAKGLRFTWGRSGARVLGDVSLVTSAEVEAVRRYPNEFHALAAWRHLQDLAEARHEAPWSRLYPFLAQESANWWTAPTIRTPAGPAYLVAVRYEGAWVVRVRDHDAWQADTTAGATYSGPSYLVPCEDVWPPATPPTPLSRQ